MKGDGQRHRMNTEWLVCVSGQREIEIIDEEGIEQDRLYLKIDIDQSWWWGKRWQGVQNGMWSVPEGKMKIKDKTSRKKWSKAQNVMLDCLCVETKASQS